MVVRRPQSVDDPSRRLPTAIEAPKRQPTELYLKEKIVASDRAQSDENQHTSHPFADLRGPGREAVQTHVLDEHDDLTSTS
jgi:hypothetical protein